MASQGKIVEVLFENAIETYEAQNQLLDLCSFEQPEPAMMQNSDNWFWRSVEQHAPILSGWDLTGQEQNIIEETCPFVLGTPTNDLVQQRADQVRDLGFWERRGKASGEQQATELNKAIASRAALQGSLFIRTNTASGYTAVATAQALMNERQLAKSAGRNFVLNDRDTLLYAQDLAGRQTLQGRPADTWASGQIGKNVAEFDVYTGSYLPNLVGGADPAATVTGDQSFVPEGGSVSATGVVTNVDYRIATIVVSDSTGYNIGDKVSFSNGATTVKALGLADKSDTGQAMTFTIVAKPNGTSISVFPKPIAYDDPALTATEQAYANIDTQILDTATVDRLNIDASNKTNLFWEKSAMTVIGGTMPANLFAQFAGKKVLSKSLKNGLTMYMLYDGDITTATFKFRIFTWYGITVNNPSNVGVMVTY